MAFVNEIQCVSTGYPGAPGYSNFYFAGDVTGPWTDDFGALYSFWVALQPLFPTGWNVRIPAEGRLLEETTGALGAFSVNSPATATDKPGTSGSGFGAGVAGAVIGWGTGTINRSRLVRGRTFMVPLSSAQYDADGTLTPTCIGILQSAANGLIASPSVFGVWSRPRLGVGGKFAPALTARVSDRASFLSSRRG